MATPMRAAGVLAYGAPAALSCASLPPGWAIERYALAGHRATVVLTAEELHLAHGVWAALAEHAAALDARVRASDAARVRPGRATAGLGPIFLRAAALALAAARATHGAYDPTRRAGGPGGAASRVEIDAAAGTLWLPPGIGLDLEPIAAALAVDAAAAWLGQRTRSALVMVDRCAAAVGEAPGGGWRIGRPDASRPRRLRSGAMAIAAQREPGLGTRASTACSRTAFEAAVALASERPTEARRRARPVALG